MALADYADSLVSVARLRGWFTVEETATLTGYQEGSLRTMKSARRGLMKDAERASDGRVRVPFDSVMNFLGGKKNEES